MIRELEERCGTFQREATESAFLISQLEQTLRAEREARQTLQAAVDRQNGELRRAAEERRRVLAQAGEIARRELVQEIRRAMDAAEDVRREGVEALEQARELERRPRTA